MFSRKQRSCFPSSQDSLESSVSAPETELFESSQHSWEVWQCVLRNIQNVFLVMPQLAGFPAANGPWKPACADCSCNV